jgi:glycosyltransferase involved in cell wall biosynthesis
MRIALLAPLFESVPPRYYGGTERVVYNLCRGLIENNIEVTLFASGDSCVEGAVVPIVDEALRLRAVPVADSGPFHIKMLACVSERAAEFDVIHNHHDYWMLPLSRMTEVPILTTLHGRLDLAGWPEVLNVYSSGFYASISDTQRKLLEATASPALVSAIKWMRTVYNGIDVDAFKFREQPGKYLAFLGRICPEKRPEWAIEIAKQSGVPLLIAAKIEKGEGAQYYETFVKPHVDGKFIQYVGEISESEKSEFLGGALALTFPVDWPEPFGLVMVESLACGTPVLARPCGSVMEVLSDGVTGFIDADIQRLAQKVKDLPLIDRKGCRKWAEERFSFRRMTKEYIDVYRSLGEQPKKRGDSSSDSHRRDLLYPVQRPVDGNP